MQQYDRLTRRLHAGIALTIVIQLLTSLWMVAPDPGEAVTALQFNLFRVHEYSGLLAFALIVIHWGWSLSSHVKNDPGALFPWFSGRRLGMIGKDVGDLLRFKLSAPGEHNALASAVHGLGLLTGLFMAGSGVIIYIGRFNGGLPPAIDHLQDIHSFAAWFIWAYFWGHLAMAVLHQLAGHRALSRIFSLSEK